MLEQRLSLGSGRLARCVRAADAGPSPLRRLRIGRVTGADRAADGCCAVQRVERSRRATCGPLDIEVAADLLDEVAASPAGSGGEAGQQRVVADDADDPRDAAGMLVDRHDRLAREHLRRRCRRH